MNTDEKLKQYDLLPFQKQFIKSCLEGKNQLRLWPSGRPCGRTYANKILQQILKENERK